MQAKQERIEHRATLANARVGLAMRNSDVLKEESTKQLKSLERPIAETHTIFSVLQAIVQDGFLSGSNAARAREALHAAESGKSPE